MSAEPTRCHSGQGPGCRGTRDGDLLLMTGVTVAAKGHRPAVPIVDHAPGSCLRFANSPGC